MADTLYTKLWSGQYQKQGYSIYRILKDYDHPYAFWYVVMYESTFNDAMRKIQTTKEYDEWAESLCYEHAIDIRNLSTYIPAKTCRESVSKEYVAPIIRNAVKKGELKPV